MSTNYFNHPYCSNSALSKMGREMGLLPHINADVKEAYRFGTLFDAVVTEPHNVDLLHQRIIGTDYYFSQQEYVDARKMKDVLRANTLFGHFSSCKPIAQHEVYKDNVRFSHEGMNFYLNMRGKLDWLLDGMMVADLKSTAATSQRAFEASFEQFGYDRQMVLYCNLTDVNNAVVFAVSKANFKVFTVQMQRGDKRWKRGEEELNMLAFKYYMTHETA